jgi:hypothetical protein
MYLTELCGREEVNFRLEMILTSNCVLLHHHEHRIENFDGDRKENLAEKHNNAFLDAIHSFPSSTANNTRRNCKRPPRRAYLSKLVDFNKCISQV